MSAARGSRLPRRSTCGCLAALALLLPALAYLALWAAGGLLIVADPLSQADAVVVLSGDPGLRVQYAAQLFKDGYAGYFIVTETGVRPSGERFKAGDLRAQQAARAGVPDELILVAGGSAGSTLEEAREVRGLLSVMAAQDNRIGSIIVVTDPFHSLRTRLIFQRELRGLGVKISVRPVPGHWYLSSTWFLSRRGWRETMGEYAKMAAYLVGIE